MNSKDLFIVCKLTSTTATTTLEHENLEKCASKIEMRTKIVDISHNLYGICPNM